ncbi:MAG TPA: HIT domain-containing protein [Candidatus Methylomirabilis sp.]|nr:HIT domain-containing protein [Candidatus Methylomirabilis sp.]
MDRLWAPWRMKYVGSTGGPGACVFCAALTAGDDARALVLHRGPLAFLILNAYPYASGHLMAAVNRHGCALDEATADELAEVMTLTQQAIRILRATYHPHGFNVGVNQGKVAGAGIPDHLHVHIVPRWDGDTSFMTVVSDTKVLPESLETTYGRLAAALRSHGP